MGRRSKTDKTSWIVLGVGVVGLFAFIGSTKLQLAKNRADLTAQASADSAKIDPKDSYLPKIVILTEPVLIPFYANDQLVVKKPMTVGMKLPLKEIKRDKIVVEIYGVEREISPVATDLLEQMIEAPSQENN